MTDQTPPRPRGHVEATPEARPLPPTWRDHLQGPIPGMPARPTPAAASASGPGAGHAAQAGQAPAPQPTPPPTSTSIPAPAAPAAPPPPEPRPAFQPDANRPIPLYGDGRERAGGERQQRSGWDASDLIKPFAAGAVLLAVAGIRLAARGVGQLADALASRRRE